MLHLVYGIYYVIEVPVVCGVLSGIWWYAIVYIYIYIGYVSIGNRSIGRVEKVERRG